MALIFVHCTALTVVEGQGVSMARDWDTREERDMEESAGDKPLQKAHLFISEPVGAELSPIKERKYEHS